MRQDGFLPLLHVADVLLTLPVWGERPGGCQNDKHLSRKGPRSLSSKSPHAAPERLWVISGLEQIKALTQHPALMSSPN